MNELDAQQGVLCCCAGSVNKGVFCITQWDAQRAWSISQATEEALRRLRPEGHVLTPEESRKIARLLKKKGVSEGQDLNAYLRANTDLLRVACESYSRHLRDPQSSPELPDVRSVRSR